jgi:hypothetical protein
LDELGDDFEKTQNGFVDYLLLDRRNFPIAVLEAKSEKYDPLLGKEQARKYAHSQHTRFVLLSNGNLHYFWDLEHGNPVLITEFPTPDSLGHFSAFKPNPESLTREKIETDYVVKTQNPNYANDPRWSDSNRCDSFIKEADLKFLRPYQIRAVEALQKTVADGQNRFLFEMATGTGKTLTAAKEFSKYKLEKGDILFNRTNSYELVGKTGLFILDGNYTFASYLVRLRVRTDIADPFFLCAFMNTEGFQAGIKKWATKAIGQSNINASSLGLYQISLPSIDIQRQIVSSMESERELIESNRKLIEIFEKKVQDKLGEIWGENEG